MSNGWCPLAGVMSERKSKRGITLAQAKNRATKAAIDHMNIHTLRKVRN